MSCANEANKPHDFVTLTQTWQTVDYVRYQVLQHSKQVLICKVCKTLLDPFNQPESDRRKEAAAVMQAQWERRVK